MDCQIFFLIINQYLRKDKTVNGLKVVGSTYSLVTIFLVLFCVFSKIRETVLWDDRDPAYGCVNYNKIYANSAIFCLSYFHFPFSFYFGKEQIMILYDEIMNHGTTKKVRLT